MAGSITLSHNELKALLSRTFEALYGHKRDYSDMADCVLWLECHGHDGVDQLVQALPNLQTKNLPNPTQLEVAVNHHVVDGKGHSLFCLMQSICELALFYAQENNYSRIDVTNVSDTRSLLGVLSYAASQGFAARAVYDGVIATINTGDKYPTIIAAAKTGPQGLICAQLQSELPELKGKEGSVLMTQDIQKETYHASLQHGLTLKRSHYETLNKVANEILVEATEASRRGAGE